MPPVSEAKAEEKNIKESVKSLNHAEKAEAKAAKAEQKAEKVCKDHKFELAGRKLIYVPFKASSQGLQV